VSYFWICYRDESGRLSGSRVGCVREPTLELAEPAMELAGRTYPGVWSRKPTLEWGNLPWSKTLKLTRTGRKSRLMSRLGNLPI
jgi:hypothetical protein